MKSWASSPVSISTHTLGVLVRNKDKTLECLPSTPMLYYAYVLIIAANKNLALASIVLKIFD
jgi:hypothetical protein